MSNARLNTDWDWTQGIIPCAYICGKKLDRDGLSLSDYGICSGSTLVANVPIRAGMVGGDKEKEEECKHLCADQPITSPLFHKFGIPYQDKEYDCLQPQAEEAHGPYPSSLFYDDKDNKQSSYGLCSEQACLRDGECYPKEVAAAASSSADAARKASFGYNFMRQPEKR